MKKLFFCIFIVCSFIFTACDKDKNDATNPTETSTISCSPSEITDDGSGNNYTLYLTSAGPWTVSKDQEWVTISPDKGQGDAIVSIKVDAGSTAVANILFSNSKNSTKVIISRIVSDDGKENGHDYVDLGLSVNWATMNVGATKPEDVGSFYAWGEVTPRGDTYSWTQYKFCNDEYGHSFSKYVVYTPYDYGTVDNKTTLEMIDDVAHTKWGGKWRMPTASECEELIEKCSFSKKQYEEMVIVNGPNGKSIVFPWAEYKSGGAFSFYSNTCGYWTSSLGSRPDNSMFLELNYSYAHVWETERVCGMLIRPVCDKK